MKTIRNLKVGDFFKRKSTSNDVYVRGEYDRGSKKYSCHKFEDVNCEIFIKGDNEVFVEFEF